MDNLKINGINLNKTRILNLLKTGKTIGAIKYIKDETNLGLKDCKEIVDTLEEHPDSYGGAENTIIEPTLKSRNKIIKNRDHDFKGSHVLKNKNTNSKNSLIVFLVIVVAILLFLLLK